MSGVFIDTGNIACRLHAPIAAMNLPDVSFKLTCMTREMTFILNRIFGGILWPIVKYREYLV